MFRRRYIILFTTAIVAALVTLALFVSGCSENPAASIPSAESDSELWNPAPGTQIIPGRDVPMLDDNYWENAFGPSVNPLRRVLNTVENIGELGGTVQLGLHSYVIPPGAVSENHLFLLSLASLTGVAVDCEPSPFSFDEPVLLTLSYRFTQYDRDGADPSNLRIYYVTPDGEFQELESTVDTEARCVRAYVDHFSRYVLA